MAESGKNVEKTTVHSESQQSHKPPAERNGVEEICLNEEEMEAIEAVWEKIEKQNSQRSN